HVQAPAPAPAPEWTPAPAPAPAPAQAVHQVADVKLPSIERALSGPARDMNASWGGKVKIVTGNGATHGPGARDQEAQDRNRARLPVSEPRRILVLGCTSGAGQSVTALMTASMLASLREHPVAAVDLHDGTLARYRAPAAWLEELLAGQPPQHIRPTRPDGLHPTPKPSPARLDVVASHEPLSDGDEIKLAVQLNRRYPLTVLDPGAAGLTRLLKITDQLVVVVPANADAAGALADTRDWLDNNGHADLAMQSVTVINGVSRRSLPDVESAESIARGRSRAIVRVPWDDMLPVAAASPSTLRPQTRVAYTALAGVLVAGLAAAPVRKKQ
ncbi:MAG: MinD/ParA family ATP-binding protein, partial [Trebonia sp.]